MISNYRRLVLHPFSVLLLLVAMVFATAVDAAECGAELAPGDAVTWVASNLGSDASTPGNDGSEEESVDQHGVCGHGHCHHGASFVAGPNGNELFAAVETVEPSVPFVLTSNGDTRLKRPPRI